MPPIKATKLLEKIEELTLHLIRMEKELEATKSQLKNKLKESSYG